MPAMQHRVHLTTADRTALRTIVDDTPTPARTAKRAQALLLTDRDGPRWPDARVATATGLSVRTVCRVREAWTVRGLDAVYAQRRRAVTPPKLDDEQVARLLAVRADDPPTGHARWTLQMLATSAVELGITATLSRETVRRTLKKTGCAWA